MLERRHNDMNNLDIVVDWDKREVKFLDMEGNELPLYNAWGKKEGRHYPAIKSPTTGKLMLCHRLVGYTYLKDQFNERVKMNVEQGKGYERLLLDHIDNNPFNCMPDNLRWCNAKENHEYRKTQPEYKSN